METFNFPFHRVSTKYPDNATRIKLGRAYTFRARPDAPDERTFTLKFQGFKYFVAAGVLDLVTNANINNMGVLEAFYREHGTWKEFLYPHPNPSIGTIVVTFDKPLEIPEGIPGADGMVQPFDINLIEVPS